MVLPTDPSQKAVHTAKTTSPLVPLIAGGVAGGVEAASTYPFDFAKTRAQLARPPSTSPSHFASFRLHTPLLIHLYRTEGLRSLYKGCPALIAGSVLKDSIRFLTFDTIHEGFRSPVSHEVSPDGNLVAGLGAGVVASVFAVTPTERIKTALIDDAARGAAAAASSSAQTVGGGNGGAVAAAGGAGAKHFTSTFSALRILIHRDGPLGLWHGCLSTTLKAGSVTAFRMGSYSILKDREIAHHITQSPFLNFVNGAAAGTMTTLVSMPFDVVKTRCQAREGRGFGGAVLEVWREGGVAGFWRGTGMRLGRTVVSGGILFTTAEFVASMLNPLFAKDSGEDHAIV